MMSSQDRTMVISGVEQGVRMLELYSVISDILKSYCRS